MEKGEGEKTGGREGGKGRVEGWTLVLQIAFSSTLKSEAHIIYIPLFQREQQSVQLKSRI